MFLNRLVDFHEILYSGEAIQGDLDAIYFNPITWITLNLLWPKVVTWTLIKIGVGLFMYRSN
jgi:hypothetical protein